MIWSGLILLLFVSAPPLEEAARLPGTAPLVWEEADLSHRLMDGAHTFVERKIREAAVKRERYWPSSTRSAQEWPDLVESNRSELRTIIGAVDDRVTPRMERVGDVREEEAGYSTPAYEVVPVRWAVLDGVSAEGLWVRPRSAPKASVVLIPDADQDPEQLLGIEAGIPPESQIARLLAANGVELVIPALIRRDKLVTDDESLRRSDQTSREWLYRQAFHMGRHPIGYEVQMVLAAVDWLEPRQGSGTGGRRPVGLAGYAEGGLIALYAAALDTRIDAVLVSGYFDSRERVWAEPIYRNIWSLLRRFGDAEIASLIQPRGLVIEASSVPTLTDQKGEWRTPPAERVAAEARRILVPKGGRVPLVVEAEGGRPYSAPAAEAFLGQLGLESPVAQGPVPRGRGRAAAGERQSRLVGQIEGHVQKLVRDSEHVRDRFFLYAAMPELENHRWSTLAEHPVHEWSRFAEASKWFRRKFRSEAIGEFDEERLPTHPRSRQILETERWTAYDVVLDVYPDLFAWGVLLVPKDLKPGEKRPVVVCQHGRDGVPRDTIDGNETAYNNFAAQLAERGFITFSPHNLYRFEDRYRWLDRKANAIGCTLFSFILAQHDQILRWLQSLEFVDGERIAFYGLSYGGETAVRIPSILEGYRLSICSGDFNQWTRKVAATDEPFSYMRTIEWEMPYWNLGNTFDYAEMAYLMIPRPFMVERGHLDLVGRDRWVAYEYAKVRWLYAQLGLADRTEITYFQGGHSIRGEATFDFLHRHLDWPKPAAEPE